MNSDFGRVAHVDPAQFHPERRCRGLDCGELADRSGQNGISKNRHSRHLGRDLFQQFQPFPADAELVVTVCIGSSSESWEL
jgi:hypothetical protein